MGLGKVLTSGSNLAIPWRSPQNVCEAHAGSNSSELLSSLAPSCSERRRDLAIFVIYGRTHDFAAVGALAPTRATNNRMEVMVLNICALLPLGSPVYHLRTSRHSIGSPWTKVASHVRH